ncbi:pre-rRNA-processing protein TSR1 homolog [Eurytemora carolleeae]|uniref:pre-rRNA-processing protein TSR1 homolog n=1 Tax=Eurytemora carolleeae TaxID=1294199 RepID=UPI000C75A765|nr:pre-rRNA-processing protein TSR1 homolog [Eurytemora carolleeae]|eukprot:XP_023320999.1 pre-rRNA-processing protein TSR1 homolog [Eurytemora affinis]
MASVGEAHRAGAFKQSNKSHKTGRHKSKGAVEKENRGRVSAKVVSKKGIKVQRKQDRKNHLTQARNLARQEVTARKRGIGGHGAPPVLVALIPLSDSQVPNVPGLLEKLTSSMQDAEMTKTESGVTHLMVPRFKQRFSFIIPSFDSLYEILDVAKVCDTVMFLLCPHTGLSERGELILSSVLAQGIPADPLMVLGSADEIPPSKLTEVKKLMIKALERKFPAEKIYTLETDTDAVNLVRTFGSQKRRSSTLRERRGNMLAETVQYIPGEAPGEGSLELTGFVRSQDISVNRLVHIPGLGDFQLEKIEKLQDPCPISKKNEMEDLSVLLPNDDIVDLETEIAPDGMDGEQTWPTDEELAQAEHKGDKKRTKRVPKGTSEYQAAWIEENEEDKDDAEDDENEDDDEEMNEVEDIPAAEESDSEDESEDEKEDMAEDTVTESEAGNTEDYDMKHVNFSEEVNELERLREARLEAMFPDEVDTPRDTQARVRFQKYRGLKSFRTTVWDPKENLPYDYGRIFQFENFLRTKKRILSEAVTGAEVGWYVKIYVKGVGAHLKPQIEERDRLIFHCGWRRFASCPIFSQHSTGNKHKYERYFRDDVVVMTTFAPITFPPAPVLVFQELTDGTHSLLGSGTLLSADPDRVIVKRTLLSGHPFKVLKRHATVRFMFFNREDIEWFKPIELRTKMGRRGHIKEPLGTHGHMKCIFDGQLNQQDTVLLHLFKRVFPKWTYDPFVSDPDQPRELNTMES